MSEKRPSSKNASEPNRSVFINCPFDEQYQLLFWASIFAVLDCGYVPRSALEAANGAEVRLDKIFKIIQDCRYGLHDLSRTELDPVNNLPRFNMPFELGIFLGAKRFGDKEQRAKNCLIMDREKFRFQRFISDISGQDIEEHDLDPHRYILRIRDWLNTSRQTGSEPLPGGAHIADRFKAFKVDLPEIAKSLKLEMMSLSFRDYTHLAAKWLNETLAASSQAQ
ncbi:MAG: hypothetical protein K2P95_08360 [Hyphomonadaceae bacterium]|nr:hypothetical protein [Hyphomonadaceae bacterium]